MGILKKVFKPVSKVLDKIIPNEVKPFLPYAAAFAPMIAPGIMGAFGNTMLSRAAIGGGLNIFGQLAQEGNEGDINLLSAGLGALTGAMTGPGASAKFRSMQTGSNPIMDFAGERTALQKATDFGLEGLAKGSDIFAAGMKDPFSMAGLKAAALPAATATGDLMFAQAKRDQDEYDRMMEEEAAAAGEDSAARAFAIRQAMEAYGFSEDEIVDAIAAAGYKKGGRVGFEIGGLGALGRKMGPEVGETDMSNVFSVGDGLKIFIKDDKDKPEITGTGMQGDGEGGMEEIFVLDDGSRITVMDYIEKYGMPKNFKKGGRVGYKFGGIDAAIKKVEDESIKESAKMVADMPDMDLMDLIEEFEIIFKRKPMNMEELKQFYRETYEMESPVRMKEKIKETVTVEAKDGGRINFDEGGISLDEQQMEIIKSGGPKIVGLLAEADKMMGTEGDRLEMALKMLLRDNKDNELLKYMLDTAEERGTTKLDVLMDLIKSQRIQDISAFDEGKKSVVDKISVKDLARKEGSMKDGGLMDLGGKEMDLRGGGFVPIGKKERADDVPARLSKNEFVMTADAVRAAGGGNVNKGAKRMYNLMNTLEARA